jgi:PEP-CTERM motif
MTRNSDVFRPHTMGLLFLFVAVAPASAQVFDLAPPPSTYVVQEFPGNFAGGAGDRRSFYFEDVLPFQLTSVEVEVNPTGTTLFTASLYSVIGINTPGSLLTTNSAQLPDLNRGFYSIPLSRAFAGTSSRYLLDVQWSPAPEEVRFYSFEGFGDVGGPEGLDPPYVVGPVRVIDGRDGGALAEPNYIIAHFRIGTVPEPASAGLLGLGISCLIATMRRRSTRG